MESKVLGTGASRFKLSEDEKKEWKLAIAASKAGLCEPPIGISGCPDGHIVIVVGDQQTHLSLELAEQFSMALIRSIETERKRGTGGDSAGTTQTN